MSCLGETGSCRDVTEPVIGSRVLWVAITDEDLGPARTSTVPSHRTMDENCPVRTTSRQELGGRNAFVDERRTFDRWR